MLRRLGFLSAALLTATTLTACSAEPVEADDPKPSTTTGSSAPSGAPGGAPDEGGLALADAIRKIPVAEEKRTGYERDAFKHWVDEDDDGCPTRQEVLLAEAVTAPEEGARCTLSGGSWTSYYDEAEVSDAKKLDIDHMVPLAEAWDSGAHDWTPERREAYANDLDAERSLVAVTAKTNRSKAGRLDRHEAPLEPQRGRDRAGSPPRTRRTVRRLDRRVRARHVVQGPIAPYVRRSWEAKGQGTPPKHPRVGGEHEKNGGQEDPVVGTPPRRRGCSDPPRVRSKRRAAQPPAGSFRRRSWKC